MHLPVTYLFVPGNRPERFDKAAAAGADAIILDLEDAVAPADKDAARAHIRQWLAAHAAALSRSAVRINDSATPWFAADLELLRAAGVRLAMLPKAETPAQIAAVRAALPPDGLVLPIIETARGVQNLAVVAAAPGYPAAPELGALISGLDSLDADAIVFHAGTAFAGDGLDGTATVQHDDAIGITNG